MRCTCHSALHLKEDRQPRRDRHQADLPSDEARRAEWLGALAGRAGRGLLDLSCLPFTHNVSFMNAWCADLIPFSTALKKKRKPYCAHSRAESARHCFQLTLLLSLSHNATLDIWGVPSNVTSRMLLEGVTDDILTLCPPPSLPSFLPPKKKNPHCIPHRREKRPCESLIAVKKRKEEKMM